MTSVTFGRDPVEALGWTLLHFVWQGAALAVLFAGLNLALARARAGTRYAAACGVLLLILAVPIATFVSTRMELARSHAMTSLSAAPAVPHLAGQSDSFPGVRAVSTAGATGGIRVSPRMVTRVIPWLVAFWSLGVLVLSVRLLGGWWLVHRLQDVRNLQPLEEWQVRAARLARSLGVSRPVRLCRSALVHVPTAIGWLKPVILLPAVTLTGMRASQIEAIVAHELAHIRRHDYLINLLQCMIETLLFYHPAVWWVSNRVREERELCCDDLAVQVLGDPVGYAQALADLEQLRDAPQLSLAASGGSLVFRIARLLGTPPRRHDPAARGLGALVGAASLIALVGLGDVDVPASAERDNLVRATTAAVRAPIRATVAALTHARAPEISQEDVMPATAISLPAEEEASETPAELAAIRRFTVDEWIRLHSYGVGERTIAGFAAAGYPDLTAEQLISLSSHGVTPEYARGVREVGTIGDATPENLVRMASNGVSTAYLQGLRAAGLDAASTEGAVRLAQHGVSSEFITGLRGIDPDELSVDELVRLADHGVSPQWYSAMKWIGLQGFTVDSAIRLRDSGVSPEYVNQLKLSTRRQFTLDELRSLVMHGVNSLYAGQLRIALRRDVPVEEIVQMHDHGVAAEYVFHMTALSHGTVRTADLIQLHYHGVSADYASQMATAGFTWVETEDLVRLYTNGVSAATVNAARESGQWPLTVDELIRLHTSGAIAGKETK